MIVKRTIPGYIWFDGNEIFKLRFHDELMAGTICDIGIVANMRIDRMKRRRAAFKTYMRRAELFILSMWAAIIAYAAVRSF